MSARTIFYAWQSDTPSRSGTDLVERALKTAIAHVSSELAIELKLDRDTQGVPGSPQIIDAILRKIQQCSVMVADVTFVGRVVREGHTKGLPNPNVMMEFGFALEAIGWKRIITVLNEHDGPIRDLPFDIASRRLSIVYRCAPGDDEGTREQAEVVIASQLRERIREILVDVGTSAAADDFASPFADSETSFLAAEVLAKKGSDDGERNVVWINGPQSFLRLIPRAPMTINSRVELRDIALGGNPNLQPLGRWTDGWHAQNHWGFVQLGDVHEDSGRYRPWCFTQLFRSGEIWGIDQRLLRPHAQLEGQAVIPSQAIEEIFSSALRNYLAVAQNRLLLAPPVKIICGLGFIANLRLAHSGPIDRLSDPCPDPSVVHQQVVESFDMDPNEVLIPFYTKVWDACGLKYRR